MKTIGKCIFSHTYNNVVNELIENGFGAINWRQNNMIEARKGFTVYYMLLINNRLTVVQTKHSEINK